MNVSKSEYVRSLITNKKPVEVDYRQEIVPIIGKIFVVLQESGLDDGDIIREVHKLCQKLS